MSAAGTREDAYRRAANVSVPGMVLGGGVLALIGLGLFLALALGGDPARAWRVFHINFLFFTGIAQGAVVFVAVYRLTQGWWAGPIVRFAEAAAAFLPVSLICFLILFLGRHHLFPWIAHPTPARGAWLTTGFVFWRDLASLLVLFGVTIAYVWHDLKPDVAPLASQASGFKRRLYGRIGGDFTGTAEQVARNERRLARLAGLLVVLYGYLFSIIAFDLVMSLSPWWVSTIFGWFFFWGAFLSGLTTTGLMTVFWRSKLDLKGLIGRQQFHDFGKLVFGFSIFWTYLMYSQFLVHWYGNLPVETSFQFYRLWGEWRPVAILVGLMVFLIPFWGLIWVKSKVTPLTFTLFLGISWLGIWLERYLLVEPSLSPAPAFGLPELGVSLGFLGLFLLAYGLFAGLFPMVSPRHAEQATYMHH